jgi:diadenosine tetraphosphate (Ap4A) HIT family hydrolase
LHVHIIARRQGDVAWPRPVWGQSPPLVYDKTDLEEFVSAVRRKVWLS